MRLGLPAGCLGFGKFCFGLPLGLVGFVLAWRGGAERRAAKKKEHKIDRRLRGSSISSCRGKKFVIRSECVPGAGAEIIK